MLRSIAALPIAWLATRHRGRASAALERSTYVASATTLATRFWSETGELAYGAAAPYAALMVALSAPAAYVLAREARRTTGGPA